MLAVPVLAGRTLRSTTSGCCFKRTPGIEVVKFPVEDRYAHSSENEAHVTEGGLMTEEDVTFRYTSEIFAHRGGGELSRRIEEDLFLYYADGHLRRSLWKFHFGNGHRLSI